MVSKQAPFAGARGHMRPEYVTLRGISESLRCIADSLKCIAQVLQQQPMQHEALLSEMSLIPTAVDTLAEVLQELPPRLRPERPRRRKGERQ